MAQRDGRALFLLAVMVNCLPGGEEDTLAALVCGGALKPKSVLRAYSASSSWARDAGVQQAGGLMGQARERLAGRRPQDCPSRGIDAEAEHVECLSELAGFPGEQRSLSRMFQVLSCAFALSPSAEFAWARLAYFCGSVLFSVLCGPFAEAR